MVGIPSPSEPRAGERVTVRLARPADAPVIAALLAGGAVTNQEDPADIDAYARALAEVAGTRGNDVLVAELDGTVVGTCQLLVFRHIQQRGGLCAEVESVHVAESHRSRGIGAVLLAAAVERARLAGAYRVQLTSNAVRTDAHRFYERHGFDASHVGFKRRFDGR